MKETSDPDKPSPRALALHRPSPGVLYSLDTTAHLAGVTRRTILIYCREGIVQPGFQAPYGAMVFTEETIWAVRQGERMRAAHGIGLALVKTMFDLVAEAERLRAELRFHRSS